MPAKKTASKKRKKVSASKKKAVTKKAAARKTASKKRKVTKKKTAAAKAKKAAGKKKVSRKKTSKKAASKKAAKKAVSRKKAAKKKTSGKSSKKSKKKPAKKVAKKAVSKASSRKVSKKKPAASKARGKKSPARRSKAALLSGPIHGIDPYQPKRGEEYMSSEQLEHFRDILTSWKRELMFEVDRTVHHMQDEAANFPDPNDRATQESEFGLELRTRDRERKLLRKIDSALARIDDGSYGWCDETGEEIGLKRLEARPVATLCLEAQERRELAERQFRDRDDRYR